LTWGFQNYHTVPIAKRGQTAGNVVVRRGAQRTVSALFSQDSYVTLGVSHEMTSRTLKLPPEVEAPVNKGQVLGYLIAKDNQGEIVKVPAVAAASVARIDWKGGVWRYLWKIAG
jgi:D-alanyl-D-alanine carboxypeptidase (penicillin-binding protein 5/6)